MQLRDSIQKAKIFFHKNLQNLRTLLLGGYEKLPKPTSFKPFSCSSKGHSSNHQTDRYYADICDEWQCDLEKAMKGNNGSSIVSKPAAGDAEASDASSMKLVKSPLKKKEERVKEEKNKTGSQLKKGEPCSKSMNELARKMKELEMMDVSDVEHVLDVEEALHYYSRLKSPAYVDIVDNFFLNMYSEFSVPKPSASINTSKRRLGSISNRGIHQRDQYYTYFCNEWECDMENSMKRKSNHAVAAKEPERKDNVGNEFSMILSNSPLRKKEEEGKLEENKKSPLPSKSELSSMSVNGGANALAQKMKEFEMLDASNVEHVLDVEEALHYYSRLKSPVYLDMVDKFFTNMYTECSAPQATAITTASTSNSNRILGSIQL
ncbi:hypothetical protein Tsubulata_040937 [Turnera subulata]|uniref:OVATE domain-containing protein n=1 Tax=Turnera subulata TaxID=218843 RepID=A0A9Q0JIZ9_9ROSI|nr:hypothetical protein Tsubulata_040937 [Turnera subulata]